MSGGALCFLHLSIHRPMRRSELMRPHGAWGASAATNSNKRCGARPFVALLSVASFGWRKIVEGLVGDDSEDESDASLPSSTPRTDTLDVTYV